ncbi:MAG: protein-glutamate O-methyltransferase CheR [Clostridia bacterium]|jgi:chemotaxis protein methyltransferase CheR
MIKISDNEFRRLVVFVKRNYGINLSQKRNLIEGRLGNIVAAKGFNEFSGYLDYVFSEKGTEEIINMINKLTTNHTFFMRESSHFDYFKQTVLPYLKTNKDSYDLRLWSAGCSSGEEAYTLAMIVDEFFEGNKEPWEKTMLATDISTNVLEKAENGIYEHSSVLKMPKSYQEKYFVQISKDQYQVVSRIRQRIVFRKFNLMTEKFPFKKKFDVVFCRNVMIYFDKETKEALLGKIFNCMEEGGYLFVGQAESITRSSTGFTYVMPSIYRKV